MKRIVKLMTFLILMFSFSLGVEAASFTVSVGSKSLSKGSTTKLTIKGSDVTGRFNIKSSNSSVVSISEDRAWIENDSYSITLSALSVGTATITVTPSAVSDSAGNSASLSAKTITITVSLPREKSSDNNLKSLSVQGYEITPEFNKDTTEYSVSVQEGTKVVNISASPNSRYASVSGTGEKEVISGINSFNVVVTAENGDTKTYKVTVNVIDQNPINVSLNGSDYTVVKLRENYTCPDNFTESELVIENIPVPACVNEIIDYTLVGLKNSEGVTNSYIFKDNNYTKYIELASSNLRIIGFNNNEDVSNLTKTEVEIDGVVYSAYKYKDSDKYYVIYGINVETGEEDYYLYDTVNKTFNSFDKDYIDNLLETNKTYLYVIASFGVGLFFSIICIIVLLSRGKKKNKGKDNKKKNQKEEEIKDNVNNEIIEEVKEETETYDLFQDDKKRKKEKKKK